MFTASRPKQRSHFSPLLPGAVTHHISAKISSSEKNGTASCPIDDACLVCVSECSFVIYLVNVANWFSAWVASLKSLSGCLVWWDFYYCCLCNRWSKMFFFYCWYVFLFSHCLSLKQTHFLSLHFISPFPNISWTLCWCKLFTNKNYMYTKLPGCGQTILLEVAQ